MRAEARSTQGTSKVVPTKNLSNLQNTKKHVHRLVLQHNDPTKTKDTGHNIKTRLMRVNEGHLEKRLQEQVSEGGTRGLAEKRRERKNTGINDDDQRR